MAATLFVIWGGGEDASLFSVRQMKLQRGRDGTK